MDRAPYLNGDLNNNVERMKNIVRNWGWLRDDDLLPPPQAPVVLQNRPMFSEIFHPRNLRKARKVDPAEADNDNVVPQGQCGNGIPAAAAPASCCDRANGAAFCYQHARQRTPESAAALANWLNDREDFHPCMFRNSVDQCRGIVVEPSMIKWNGVLEDILKEYMREGSINGMDAHRSAFIIRNNLSTHLNVNEPDLYEELRRNGGRFSNYVNELATRITLDFRGGSEEYITSRLPMMAQMAEVLAGYPEINSHYLASAVPGSTDVPITLDTMLRYSRLSIYEHIIQSKFRQTRIEYSIAAAGHAQEIRTSLNQILETYALPLAYPLNDPDRDRIEMEAIRTIAASMDANFLEQPLQCLQEPFRNTQGLTDLNVAHSIMYGLIQNEDDALIDPTNPVSVLNSAEQVDTFLRLHFGDAGRDLVRQKIAALVVIDPETTRAARPIFLTKARVIFTWTPLATAAGLPDGPENMEQLRNICQISEPAIRFIIESLKLLLTRQTGGPVYFANLDEPTAFAGWYFSTVGLLKISYDVPGDALELNDSLLPKLFAGLRLPNFPDDEFSDMIRGLFPQIFDLILSPVCEALFHEVVRRATRQYVSSGLLPLQQVLLTKSLRRNLDTIRRNRQEVFSFFYFAHTEEQFIMNVTNENGESIIIDGVGELSDHTPANLATQLQLVWESQRQTRIIYILLPTSSRAAEIQLRILNLPTPLNDVINLGPTMFDTFGLLYPGYELSIAIDFAKYYLISPIGAGCAFLKWTVQGQTAASRHRFHIAQEIIGFDAFEQAMCSLLRALVPLDGLDFSHAVRMQLERTKIPFLIGRPLGFLEGICSLLADLEDVGRWPVLFPDLESILDYFQLTQAEKEFVGMYFLRGNDFVPDTAADSFVNRSAMQTLQQVVQMPGLTFSQALDAIRRQPRGARPFAFNAVDLDGSLERRMSDNPRQRDTRNTTHPMRDHVMHVTSSTWDLVNPAAIKMALGHIATPRLAEALWAVHPHLVNRFNIPATLNMNNIQAPAFVRLHTGVNLCITSLFYQPYLFGTGLFPAHMIWTKSHNTMLYDHRNLESDLMISSAFALRRLQCVTGSDYQLRSTCTPFNTFNIDVSDEVIRNRPTELALVNAIRAGQGSVESYVRQLRYGDLSGYQMTRPIRLYLIDGVFGNLNEKVGHIHETSERNPRGEAVKHSKKPKPDQQGPQSQGPGRYPQQVGSASGSSQRRVSQASGQPRPANSQGRCVPGTSRQPAPQNVGQQPRGYNTGTGQPSRGNDNIRNQPRPSHSRGTGNSFHCQNPN